MKRVHQREADLWEPRIHMSCLSILELPRAGSSAPITPSAIWKTKAAAQLSILLATCVISLKLEGKSEVCHLARLSPGAKPRLQALSEALLTVQFWESEWKKRITVSDTKLA